MSDAMTASTAPPAGSFLAAGAIALRAANTRGAPAAAPEPQQDPEPCYDPV